MQILHCPPIMAERKDLKSPSSIWGSNWLSSASSSLLQSTLTIWRRTETAYVPSINGRCHSPRIFVMAAHFGMCRRGYGGSARLWWWEHSAAPSGPGSSTSSAGWLCPASLLVSLVAYCTAFLHLWSRPSFFQSESAGISWATSQ